MKYLELIEKYILYISLFLLPVLFLPINLTMVLVFSITFILIIKTIKSIIRKGLEFNSSKFDLPVLIFISIFLLSGIFAVVNKIDSFVLPGVATFAIFAGIYYFLINQLDKESKGEIIIVMLISGFVVAILQISSLLGITKLITQLPDFMKVNTFTSFGNILNSIVFLIMLIPFLIEKIIKKVELPEKILAIIVCITFLISIISSIYLILPGKSSSISILNYKTSWSVAIDSLKTNPFLGIGPGNYTQAFLKFKPLEFNSNKNWNTKYQQGSNSLITIFTEIGIVGLFITVFIIGYALKQKDFKQPSYISMSILFLGLLLLPLSSSIFPIVFLMLALNSKAKDNKLAFFIKRYAIVFFGVLIIFALIGTEFFFGRAFYGEFLYSKAIKEINKGQGQSAYELINKAISVNRYSDRYHLLSAGINLAIAENMSKKEGLVDADKTIISQVIQQSIAEGKAAVSLNPQKSANWEALSGIYQTIIAFAEGADNFAIQSLNQAISLEPTSPILRIKLGGIYYSKGKYNDAIKSFEFAVLAKPDYANSHFNLAMAYKGNKQLDKAKEQMEIVLKLVDPNSNDYQLAKNELDAIGTKTDGEEPEVVSENLTPPSSSTPELEPQIEIPQN